jgi:hypothetical protein
VIAVKSPHNRRATAAESLGTAQSLLNWKAMLGNRCKITAQFYSPQHQYAIAAQMLRNFAAIGREIAALSLPIAAQSLLNRGAIVAQLQPNRFVNAAQSMFNRSKITAPSESDLY